jgi:plastocyanin
MPARPNLPSLLPLLALFCAQCGWAEIVIEGQVALPEVRPPAVSARYQQISGQIAAPEPPAAIVYLEGSFPSHPGSDAALAQVAQKGYQFSPGLLPIRNGEQVAFPNLDDDYHHVFSYSKTKSFDLGRYKMGEEAPKVTFDAAGTVIVGCEIHDHMRGTILVLDTPYFTKTVETGTYRLVIPEPLNGSFLLKAWVNDRKVYQQNVELHDGAVLKVDFPGS